jgi:hypothetical protein
MLARHITLENGIFDKLRSATASENFESGKFVYKLLLERIVAHDLNINESMINANKCLQNGFCKNYFLC